MTQYAIIETDDGMTIALVAPGTTAEDAAVSQGGRVIDPGPYNSYEDAYDSMLALPDEDEDE
jgi:hypothetical protein